MARIFCVFFIVYIFVFATNFDCVLSVHNLSATNFLVEIGEPTYEPTWQSLDSRPLPKWYDEAKVGIFIHWGVYSVPTFGSEWFWMNWRDERTETYVEYMQKNFKPGFTYQEFASDFTAEHFDPNEWASIIEESGAKYVVLTSKHHDGFALWPSKYSFSWNSVDIGPHRDIIAELSNAIRMNTTLKFGLYHSLLEWFNPLYEDDKTTLFNDNLFVRSKVMPQLMELVNIYQPEVIWSDGDWEAPPDYWNATEFIAWLYNESPVRKTVVTNDRWGIGTLCKHGDFYTCSDRFNPGVLQKHKWENAMTIDLQSWGNRPDARLDDFITSKALITEIVSTISCGGNILINVGPTKTGLIEPIFVERLRDMGKWLKINGEAIYSTTPWIYQNDAKTSDVWYTCTMQKSAKRVIVYAMILNYPYDSAGVNLYSLGNAFDNKTQVTMLGYTKTLDWYGSSESMYITFPEKRQIDKFGLEFAWTLKIDIPRQN